MKAGTVPYHKERYSMSQIDKWVERLDEAFKKGLFGWGTDNEEVIAVLKEAKGQIPTLKKSYDERHPGKPYLEKKLLREFERREKKKEVMRLFYGFTDQMKNRTGLSTYHLNDADLLRDAIVRLGTKKKQLMAVLARNSKKSEMPLLHATFYEKTRRDLEDALYRELNGDDLVDALQLYYYGFNRGEFTEEIWGPFTCRCDGTVTPSDSYQRWVNAVKNGLAELQRITDNFGDPLFGLGREEIPYDSKYWKFLSHKTTREIKVAYGLRNPDDPYTAIKRFAGTHIATDNEGNPVINEETGKPRQRSNLTLWASDCSMYAEIALFHIWRLYIGGKDSFNKKFRGLELYNQHSLNLPIEDVIINPAADGDDNRHAVENFKSGWECAPPGTKVSWMNTNENAEGTSFNFEFGIKRLAGCPDKKPTYDAFPLGHNLTEEVLMLKLARCEDQNADAQYVNDYIIRNDYSIPKIY